MKSGSDDILDMNKKGICEIPSKSRYNQALKQKMVAERATRDL